tara:strand:- start:18855 stop:28502 length:9648 start_codon:yes stop_codon:yes gene_type:complete
MPLSRLENFIKNVEGTILYVNPTDQDATDSIENQGNSLTRPFKTIQRALIEAARFSFVAGKDNDKFDKTTILVYPGTHKIDNRPGLSIDNNGGTAQYKDRFGNIASFGELTASSNFDIEDSANVLHYFNSVSGGVIIPRGTSLVGMDLRKTKISPLFVPDPQNSEIDRAAIFKVTGGCYFWQFSIFDGDPNGTVYKNYSNTRFTPNYSHHKLTCFEYADGNNTIELGAVTGGSAVSNNQTDLDSYYFKVSNAYGSSSGRAIPSWPTNEVLQPKLAENQIVGAVQADAIGITSVFSTNNTDYTFSGAVGKNVVVTTTIAHNLNVGTPIIVSGITTNSSAPSSDPTFNAEGGTVVAEVLSPTQFAFVASEDTVVTNPHLSGDETVQVEPDTVTGASPYIFNLSLRSVYGVNGLHADGSKATGFKSMVLAQFTGIGLQKDDNAFLLYNSTTGTYNDTTTVADSEKPLHINSKAIYKPEYETTHVKVSNGAVLQCVSIFAIGFANHFLAASGGDQSITNSNSNFGAKALIARGFRDAAFARDNSGYITHIIPPKNVVKEEESSFWVPLDVGLTTSHTVGTGSSDRLYTFGYSDEDVPPTHIIDQFRIGSRVADQLKLEVSNVTQTANIVMEGSTIATSQKISFVAKNTAGTANSITESTGSIFGLTGSHEFADGETVRILSDDGIIPDGIELDQKYFVIKTGLNADQIKLAKTFNEAVSSNTSAIENVNTTGGSLRIISAVSDKFPGDPGHPIQYDTTKNNWYINVKGDATNKIYKAIENSTTKVTSKSFISRKSDNRNLDDRIYKIRYVIPKEFLNAKPPAAGYVLQESSSTIVENTSEYSASIANLTDFRNLKVIHDIDYSSSLGIATVTSEIPHRITSGAKVKLNKVSSSNNTTAADKKGFNGIFDVQSVVDSKTFTINVPTVRDPGNFLSNRPAAITDRDENHPNFSINQYSEVYYIYRVNEISEYQENIQDGVYHLTCLLGSVNPTSSFFADRGFSQNVVNLYPMLDRDNYTMDPSASLSIASNKRVSEVETGDLTQSITKEFVNSLLVNNRYGFNITDLTYDQTTGITTATTDVQHNLNNLIQVSIANSGSGFGFSGISTTIYNAKLTGGTGEGATIRFTTNTGGNFSLTSPVIVDGGSGYSVGDTLTVSNVGIPTFSGGGVNYSTATLTVTSINQATENSIQIEDAIDHGEKSNEFNGVFRILSVPSSKKVSFLLPPSNSGIGTHKKNGKFILAGSLSTITSIEYTDPSTGIVTVTCGTAHGLNIGNAFKIDYNDESSLTSSIYNGNFIVNERVGINTFTFKIGMGVATATPPTNVGHILPTGYTAQEADSDSSRENIARRMNSFYVGISTTINSGITTSSTTVTLSNADGFEKGDYVEIGSEIVRVKNAFSSNQADILRGLFGTRVTSIPAGTLAKKIRPIPVEGRRYSILRASGHTFEYVGFGPGNYSNALPQRQDRILDKTDQLLSQSEKTDGGVVVYTGMNDSGDFYVGNRRLSSNTGQEETIGIPVPRFVGDDGDDTRLSVVFDDVTVKEFIKVEGGAGNVITSEFNGPVVFNNKVNFNSDQGSDFKFITLKGTDPDNTRRKYSVGMGTPLADADNSVGDVVFKNDPVPGGYAGWIFAGEEGSENNKWRKFGLIAPEDAEQDTDTDSNINSPLGNFTILPSKIGINTNQPQSVIEVKDGLTRLDRLYVAGIATFQDSVTLTNVTLDDLTINDRLSVSGTVSIDAPGGYVLSGNSQITGLTTHTGDYDLVGGLQVENSASVGGTLTVSGNTDLNRNLQVSGNTSLLGALSVSGITTLGDKLNVSGSLCVNGSSLLSGAVQAKTTLSVGQNLNVGNNASVGGTLKVTGDTSLDGGLNVSAATVLKAGLTVSGNTDLNKDLTVSGSTSLNGSLRVLGNTSLDNSLTVSGPTTIKNTLTLSGSADFNNNLQVSGNASIGGNLNVDTNAEIAGTLCVGGQTQLKGDVCVGESLVVNNGAVIGQQLTVSSSSNLIGEVVARSYLAVCGNLSVGGDTNLKGDFTVSGEADFNDNLQVAGNLSVGGNTNLDGALSVSGNTTLSGTLSVRQSSVLKNPVTVCGPGDLKIVGTAANVLIEDLDFNQPRIEFKGKVVETRRVRAYIEPSEGGSASANAQGLSIFTGGQLKEAFTVSGNHTIKVPDPDIANYPTPVFRIDGPSGDTDINGSLQVSGNASFGGDISVSGLQVFSNLSVGGNLSVKGKTYLSGSLSVKGTTYLSGDVTAKSNVSVEDNLAVGGITILQSILQVRGDASFATNVSVGGNTFIGGNASVGGTLCVEGQAFFNSDINISGNSLFTGRIDVSGDAMLNRSSGITTTRQLDVNGNVQASGLVCAGTLRVIGTTSLGNLDVNGTASFASSVQIAGNTSVGGVLRVPGTASIGTLKSSTLSAQGQAFVNENLTVTQNTDLNGNLTVSGTTTLSGAVQAKGNLSVGGSTSLNGTLTVLGNTSLDGSLTVSGNTQLKSNASVSGNLSVVGDTSLDGDTFISGQLRVDQTLQVQGNTSLDKDLYVSGNATIARAIVTGNLSVGGTFSAAGSANIAGDVTVSSLRTQGRLQSQGTLSVVGQTQIQGQISAAGQIRSAGSIIATQTLRATGNLCADGNAFISGTLQVTGASEFQAKLSANTISASGQVIVDQQVQADGSGLFGQTVRAGGSLCAQGQAFVNENLRVTQNTQLKGNASVGGTLKVDGTTCLSGGATISSALQLKSELDFIGAVDKYIDFMLVSSNASTFTANFRSMNHGGQGFHNHLVFNRGAAVDLYHNNNLKAATRSTGFYVSGTLCALGLDVCGNGRVTGNLSVGGIFRVAGATSLQGNLDVNGTLQVADESNFQSKISTNNISSSGQVRVDGQISAGGSILAGQTLRASGNLCADSNAFIGGALQVTQGTTLQGNATVGGTLRVAGLTSLQGGVVIDTSMDVQTTMNANAISMSGTLTIGQQANPNIQLESSASGGPFIDFARFKQGQLQDRGARIRLTGDNELSIQDTTSVKIDGQTFISGKLKSTGELQTAGSLCVAQSAQVKGNLSVGGALKVAAGVSLQGGLAVTGTSSFKGKIHADSISTSGTFTVCGTALIKNAATVCGPLKTTTICHRGASAFDQSGNADFFAIRAFGRIASNGTVLAGANFTASKQTCGNYSINFQKGIGNQKPTVVLTTSGSSSVARIIAYSNVGGQGFQCHIISGDGVRKSSGFSFMALG